MWLFPLWLSDSNCVIYSHKPTSLQLVPGQSGHDDDDDDDAMMLESCDECE